MLDDCNDHCDEDVDEINENSDKDEWYNDS